jgi:hypothetical protein
MGVLADASEITGLPRDNFEIHEISKEEFEGLQESRIERRFPHRNLIAQNHERVDTPSP